MLRLCVLATLSHVFWNVKKGRFYEGKVGGGTEEKLGVRKFLNESVSTVDVIYNQVR